MLDCVFRTLVTDDVAGPRHSLGGLEVIPWAHGFHDVEELPGHELGPHPVEEGARTSEVLGSNPAGRVELLGPVQAQVAGEDGPGHAESVRVTAPAPLAMVSGECPVGGRHTPPCVAVVHDVVVDQGRALEELHRGGEPDDGVTVGATTGAMAPVEEGRAKSLPTGEQSTDGGEQVIDVRTDLGEDLVLVDELGVDARLDPLAQVGDLEGAGHSSSLMGG